MIPQISFIIPCRNNREYIQLAYRSIRDLQTGHDIIFLDDASTDGTKEWIKTLDTDPNIIYYRNEGPERAGIARMFDKGVALCRTSIFIAFHADMVVCPEFDLHILKYLKPDKVISATRVEPPLHPSGPEKMTESFGLEVNEFDFESWYSFAKIQTNRNSDKITKGIFAPWCMYKDDYERVGGHDLLFAPQSKEDSDLFNRFYLQGYELIQSWSALVYHFTCRGSRFSPSAGGGTGQNSPEWIETTTKGMRNFYRKWGHGVSHDPYMLPIIPKKYDIGLFFELDSLPMEGICNVLESFEPLVNSLYYTGNKQARDLYIKQEQSKTLFDLSKRVIHLESYSPLPHDIEIHVKKDTNFYTPTFQRYLLNLAIILDSNAPHEVGEYFIEENELKIIINRTESLQEVPIQPIFKDYL